ncbi:MAG TPA: type II toxin-antitoxin system HicB family antitoxin [Spirochaetota bacterium]|nr:type II toxin-antitoxin system HicB family antitoxin [Spirochaetota bacterium]
MKAELAAIIEKAPESGYWAFCPEIPGANGQGETAEEARENLREAVELVILDRREDMLRGVSEDSIEEKICIG